MKTSEPGTALLESEHRYERLLASITDYTYTVEVEHGRSASAVHGKGCEAVTGYSPEEYSRNPRLWLDMVHEEDRAAVSEYITQVLAGREVPPVEHRIRRKDGRIRWIKNTAVLRKNSLGKVTSYDGLVSDITERKEAEAALARDRNLLRTLFEALPEVGYVKDAQSRFVLANPQSASLMGVRSPEELYGKSDFDFYPPELASQYYQDDQTVIRTGEPLINKEEQVVTPCGETRWLLTSKVPVRNPRGEVTGLVGIGRDITERRQADQQHRLVQARLQAILDNTSAVIYIKDLEGRYILVNRQYEQLLCSTNEQVRGKKDAELYPAHLAEALLRNDREVTRTGRSLEFEETIVHDGRYYTYLSVKFPLFEDDRIVALCGISTDITARKQAEIHREGLCRQLTQNEADLRQALSELKTSHAELTTIRQKLFESDKLESIGTLAAGVAHEVKNPLQTILFGVDYLSQTPVAAHEETAAVLHEIKDAIRRADSIIRDLVEFSATNNVDVRAEPINPIVQKALDLLRYELMKRRITVHLTLGEGIPPLKVNRTKMEQVFINLFLNACQAMGEGGELTVRTGVEPSRETGPDATAAVVVTIDDTGCGIPPEKLGKIFDPFFTTKPTGKGAGLGLAMAKKYIELHGGAIEIRNRQEGGVNATLKFRVALPQETTLDSHQSERETL